MGDVFRTGMIVVADYRQDGMAEDSEDEGELVGTRSVVLVFLEFAAGTSWLTAWSQQ